MAPGGGPLTPASFLLRRVLLAVPTVWGVATLLFLLLHLAPGDPASRLVGSGASAQSLEAVRDSWGLDDPLPVRYVRWLGRLATGDLGASLTYGSPVTSVVLQTLPNTLLLSGLALVLALLAGVGLGVWQGWRAGSTLDRASSAATLALYSVPSFWLAVVLLLLFSYLPSVLGRSWGWPGPLPALPASGVASPGPVAGGLPGVLLDRLAHLVLPVLTLTLILASAVARYTRERMAEVLEQPFILAARGRGLSPSRVLLRHALPNAVLPVLALLGLYLPFLLTGTVFVEAVFAWPGMGKLLVDAVLARDYPLVLGVGFLVSLGVVAANLLADGLLAWADPRVRPGEGSAW